MGYLAQFLGRFSESFAAAVALWPLASMVLTLPILAYLYHRDGRLRAASAVSAYLAVLYVLGLGCFTLYPLPDGASGPGITTASSRGSIRSASWTTSRKTASAPCRTWWRTWRS